MLLLRENPSVTQAELASVMNISRRSIQLLMKELTERGVIERVGSKKVGSRIVKQ
ncbi:MAG: winged helix-turn-helix transcriptional regulator [Clostridiales bacterium]|nr:winged helix-turn-helix transcriptional regulator [Clostridiales bacterium]